ncbi:MAG: hypothetical protein PHH75_04800 [Candidatus Omnitrophica bacterium]|nr:hypothetical protein [Candidatus Omnitrophota bacterium]MDD5574480.1 hypothetical protein [Candidatus Omnitrophota bacterium]
MTETRSPKAEKQSFRKTAALRYGPVLFLCLFSFSVVFADKEAPPEFVVKSGYSFGRCMMGYCDVELVIEGRKIVFSKSSRLSDFRYPPVQITRYLSAAEYRMLKNILEATEFSSAEERYGCPDCYGQGKEWLEVTTSRRERQIEMDYNATPVPVESLLIFLRKLRDQIDEGNR